MSSLSDSPNPPLLGAQTDPRDPGAATKFVLRVEEDPSLVGKLVIGLVVGMTFLRLPPFPYFVALLMFCFARMSAPDSGSYEILTQVCVQRQPQPQRLAHRKREHPPPPLLSRAPHPLIYTRRMTAPSRSACLVRIFSFVVRFPARARARSDHPARDVSPLYPLRRPHPFSFTQYYPPFVQKVAAAAAAGAAVPASGGAGGAL